jgi:hypothetical protein
MKFMPWINNGGGGDMGPTNYAYCNDYFPLVPFADSLLNMGSYGAVGYSFGPGNTRSVEPVLCTDRSAGVVGPSRAPAGRWCGLGGTVKDILTHGGSPSQVLGLWNDHKLTIIYRIYRETRCCTRPCREPLVPTLQRRLWC